MKYRKFIIAFFFIIATLFIKSKAQTVSLITNPDASTAVKGYIGSPIIYKNNLYVFYLNINSKRQLAKYDGNRLTLIANPDNGLGVYGTPTIFKGELYFIYKLTDTESKLAKFDGINIILLQNIFPDAFFFPPIIYKDKLYFPTYDINYNNGKLAEFDGTSIKELDITVYGSGLGNSPIIYKDTLFCPYFKGDTLKIAKYNNNQVSIINMPNSSRNSSAYNTHLIIFNNELYSIFKDNTDIYKLTKYNGTSLIPIPNPDTVTNNDRGFIGKPFIFKDALYGLYYDKTFKRKLAKFDGTKITLMTNPDAGEFTEFPHFQDKIIYKDALYTTYSDALNRYRVVKFDGNTATIITAPDPGSFRGYIGYPIVYNNVLYGISTTEIGSLNPMIQYDGVGVTAKFVTRPDGGPGFGDNNIYAMGTDKRGASIVFNGELLTFYQDANFAYRLVSIKTQPSAVHEKMSNVQIYPNPTSDRLKIIAPQIQSMSVTIVSILGEQLLHQQFNTENIEMDLSILPKGLYTVILKSESITFAKKIVKL